MILHLKLINIFMVGRYCLRANAAKCPKDIGFIQLSHFLSNILDMKIFSKN